MKNFSTIPTFLFLLSLSCTHQKSSYPAAAEEKIKSLLLTRHDNTDAVYFRNDKIKYIILDDTIINDTFFKQKFYKSNYRLDFYETGNIMGLSKFTTL